MIPNSHFSFPVTTTVATVTVMVPPDVNVPLGGSTILRCQYSGVGNLASLTVKWEHKVLPHTSTAIWTYDGRTNKHISYRKENKFERIGRNISREYSIQLVNAELADEGFYLCIIEHFNGQGYVEKRAGMLITIIGILKSTLTIYSQYIMTVYNMVTSARECCYL